MLMCTCRSLRTACYYVVYSIVSFLGGYYGSGLVYDGITPSYELYKPTLCMTTSIKISDLDQGGKCLQVYVSSKESLSGSRFIMWTIKNFLIYDSSFENEQNCTVETHRQYNYNGKKIMGEDLVHILQQEYGYETYYTCYISSNNKGILLQHSPRYTNVGKLIGGILILIPLFCACLFAFVSVIRSTMRDSTMRHKDNDGNGQRGNGERGQIVANVLDAGGNGQKGNGEKGEMAVSVLDDDENGQKETEVKRQMVVNALDDDGNGQKGTEEKGQMVVNMLDDDGNGEKETQEKGQEMGNVLDEDENGQKETEEKRQEETDVNIQEIHGMGNLMIVRKRLAKLKGKILLILGLSSNREKDDAYQVLIYKYKPGMMGNEIMTYSGKGQEAAEEKGLDRWM